MNGVNSQSVSSEVVLSKAVLWCSCNFQVQYSGLLASVVSRKCARCGGVGRYRVSTFSAKTQHNKNGVRARNLVYDYQNPEVYAGFLTRWAIERDKRVMQRKELSGRHLIECESLRVAVQKDDSVISEMSERLESIRRSHGETIEAHNLARALSYKSSKANGRRKRLARLESKIGVDVFCDLQHEENAVCFSGHSGETLVGTVVDVKDINVIVRVGEEIYQVRNSHLRVVEREG